MTMKSDYTVKTLCLQAFWLGQEHLIYYELTTVE